MKRQQQWHNGKMSPWLHSKCFLVIVPDYHIQVASSQRSFTSLICIRSSELYSIAKPQAFPDLKILVFGTSLSRNKFLTIPGDLVNEETINREANVRDGPMNRGYSTSFDAENDFIVDSHILAKLRKEFKNKMNFKTDSNFKVWVHRKSRVVYKKEIAIPRSKFLWSHTMHYYSNVIEKKETEKSNISPQRRPLDCWIIYEKIAWKTWGIR